MGVAHSPATAVFAVRMNRSKGCTQWMAPTRCQRITAAGLRLVIFQKAADLMHALMQHGDDADPSVAQCLPVDEMPPVTKDVAVHPELRRYRTRRDRAGRDALEGFEQPRDVGVRLGFPQRSRLYR